jgi:Protein of unknown function (DUF1573)
MKKTFLLLTLGIAVFSVNAQKATKAKAAVKAKEVVTATAVKATPVDEHAGHNHGPVSTTAPMQIQNNTNGAISDIKAVPAPVAAPEGIKFSADQYNFGKIPQGKPVTHVFKVTNISNAPYKLDNVQASCGCTTPTWDREKTLAPGESMEITVGYNAAAEGPFTKPVTVTYNGTQSKMFTITGEVWKTPTDAAPKNEATDVIKP